MTLIEAKKAIKSSITRTNQRIRSLERSADSGVNRSSGHYHSNTANDHLQALEIQRDTLQDVYEMIKQVKKIR